MTVTIDWNNMQTIEEQYPIEWIPVDDIYFSEASVPYVPLTSRDQLTFPNYNDRLVYNAMQLLPYLDPAESLEMLKYTRIEQGFDNKKELHKIHARMCLVYTAIKKEMKMYNPLILYRKGNVSRHIVIGWQRLCSLKALEYKGTVPCRIGTINDYDTNPATKAHPYVQFPDLYKRL